ncbi:hypothetical protein C9374_011378 [Naegleria lovaniensis]|uniref:Uncharacterized protein n=1 Tax=Naegleria lovaniensis TaxID=51637 RepID=A0AA88H0S5_NAELO|nr:uncharacterized protein C9374_011378 [Naegleria lovaniensis]KAG2392653.1 hypothetical protein C9374_011378 [Naegleria lovaniensis]
MSFEGSSRVVEDLLLMEGDPTSFATPNYDALLEEITLKMEEMDRRRKDSAISLPEQTTETIGRLQYSEKELLSCLKSVMQCFLESDYFTSMTLLQSICDLSFKSTCSKIFREERYHVPSTINVLKTSNDIELDFMPQAKEGISSFTCGIIST